MVRVDDITMKKYLFGLPTYPLSHMLRMLECRKGLEIFINSRRKGSGKYFWWICKGVCRFELNILQSVVIFTFIYLFFFVFVLYPRV